MKICAVHFAWIPNSSTVHQTHVRLLTNDLTYGFLYLTVHARLARGNIAQTVEQPTPLLNANFKQGSMIELTLEKFVLSLANCHYYSLQVQG